MIPAITYDIGTTLLSVRLNDVISCEVTKSENGEFSLAMKYPVNGVHADKIILRNQINAITERADTTLEPFIITKIEQNINGVISVTAQHCTYSLSHYPIRAFDASWLTPAEAIDALYANSLRDPAGDAYILADDSSVKRLFGLESAATWREALYGNGGLLDVYGGILIASEKVVRWKDENTVGEQKGTIRYGVNLTKFKRTYDASDTFSHAYVYWNGDDAFVECPKLVQLGSNSEFVGATIMDMSDAFATKPSVDQLVLLAQEYAQANGIMDVDTSMNISFVPLRLTDEYKDLTWLEEVGLYDSVSVEVPMYGSKSTARVTQTKFDVISETYKSITVGTPRRSFESTIASLL